MKNLLLIGSIVFGVGAIIFLATVFRDGFNFSQLSTFPAYEKKTKTFENIEQDIRLIDANTPITVGVSEDDKIHIIYFENKKETYTINEGTSIEFLKSMDYKWYDYILNINFFPQAFTILLPKDYIGNINLKTTNGSVCINNTNVRELNLNTSNGKIELNNITASSGVSAKSTNGEIKLSTVSANGNITLETTNARVQLLTVSGNSIDTKTSNGKINAATTKTTNSTALVTTNGAIGIDSLSSNGNILLQSSNGKIFGSIVGEMRDFTINSKTSNANNNLPENLTGGQRNLTVKTSNGGINILFR